MDAPMIVVGGITKDSMLIASEAIVKIATCSPIPEVTIKALDVLGKLGTIQNVTLDSCTFTNNPATTGEML